MVEPKKIEKINLATCAADGKKRMIMKVYLEYPSFLHKRHNDYPLAAEKNNESQQRDIVYLLRNYQRQVWNQYWASI